MITNGVVSIEDGTKAPEEFAPGRKVRVELTFAVPEGSNAKEFLDAAAAGADAKVNELLGRTVAAKPAKAIAVTPAEVKAAKAAAKAAAKSAADTNAPTAASGKAALEAAAGLTAGGPVDTVLVQGDIDDLLGDAGPVAITDAELAKAAQTKNAQMKVNDPNFSVKIRALVVEYAGNPPKKITDVPTAKRQEFLDKLRDLK